jgi:uncharacterized protein (DUF608 family)
MPAKTKTGSALPRRQFIQLSAAALGTAGIAAPVLESDAKAAVASSKISGRASRSKYSGAYSGDRLNRVAFPLGGMGAGMVCLEGTGALSHVSLKHRPEVFHEPCVFAAIAIKGGKPVARVLEGPVPTWKLFGAPNTGNGAGGTTFGLPRFRQARFQARFPFATVSLNDAALPLRAEIKGWSPFVPGNADASSLPVAALVYEFTNKTRDAVSAVFSFNARNFMASVGNAQGIRPMDNGFVLWGGAAKERSWEEGCFSATVLGESVKVNHAWFRGGWFDALTLAWNDVARGACFERPPTSEGAAAPGASLFVPFELGPGQSKTMTLLLAWHVGQTNLRFGKDPEGTPALNPEEKSYRPWYSSQFKDIQAVTLHWRNNYERLLRDTQSFSDCFHDTTLPAEVVDAVAANLTILKSPTVMRQADGRLWAWEGCSDNAGCCHGTCTHVWNYAQAIPHLFPELERSLRETEFGPSQNTAGHQAFRSALPIRPQIHDFHAAADGQLGGIMKVYRDWRIGGDIAWLRRLWPKVKASLNYCIETWDPGHKGVVEEPHHNTYDIEFWGPDGMCSSFYLGALQAALGMAKAVEESVPLYQELYEKGRAFIESELFDGEYFIQKIQWTNLRAQNPLEAKSMVGDYSTEARLLFEKEGPKYQYGKGCLSDGVLGAWLAEVCGLDPILDQQKVAGHLRSVHRYNLKTDLSSHANPQRPSYACNSEGGLLLCTWPKGGELSLPFVYSNEVWTGIEYQVASHLMRLGMVEAGLEIVRVCRDRYDGRVRNPFNEYECGHWYARAMSSYALLQGLSGARYDASEQVLYLKPSLKGDFRCFLATGTGYGTVGVQRGKPFFEVKSGQVPIKKIALVTPGRN